MTPAISEGLLSRFITPELPVTRVPKPCCTCRALLCTGQGRLTGHLSTTVVADVSWLPGCKSCKTLGRSVKVKVASAFSSTTGGPTTGMVDTGELIPAQQVDLRLA